MRNIIWKNKRTENVCKWLATIPKWNGIRTEKKLYQRCRHGVVDAIKRGSVVARTHCISMRVWRVCVSFCHASKPFHILFGRFFFSSFGFCHSGYLSFLLHADTRTRIETTHNDTFDALFLSIKWQCFVDCFFSFLCFYAVSSRHCRPPAFFKNEYCFFFHSVFIVVSNKF